MHPSLSKAERKRYAGYDPENWYEWTSELSAEFTDLMRRSPRDTSFARGFAYVCQKALPEGQYLEVSDLIENIGLLPAAFRGKEGSGFSGTVDGDGHATVTYSGMPGFSNVCIAILGELQQRLEASGAQGVEVRHGATCRLSGGEQCHFEVEWKGKQAPAGAVAADVGSMLNGGKAVKKGAKSGAASPSERPASLRPTPVVEARKSSLPEASELPSLDATGGDDPFAQIKNRLAEAERQAALYGQARAEIDKLNAEVAQLKAKAESAQTAVEQERALRIKSADSLAELKRRLGELIADD